MVVVVFVVVVVVVAFCFKSFFPMTAALNSIRIKNKVSTKMKRIFLSY